jgi:hypothetical protein
MRFVRTGADIPDELIRGVTDGEAVFLCGAGVSRRSGLPSFEGLTEQVYSQMGESRANEPAESNAFDRREYDRALRSLEKRTNRPRTESRVRKSVENILKAPSGSAFPDHLALLRLSRDNEGRTRLLTTNFDTLFERAANSSGMEIPSYAGKSLPKPGGSRDFGILHLHGRLEDAELGFDNSDLVLTSADFGDAYLRDGWASQYIEDRMRLGILVLVGYQAEDAALRLLLETLDADRDRFRDLRNIYAIEKQTKDSASIWRAKGITPIEFNDYDDIYETLGEWAHYAVNPDHYRRTRLAQILSGPTVGGAA